VLPSDTLAAVAARPLLAARVVFDDLGRPRLPPASGAADGLRFRGPAAAGAVLVARGCGAEEATQAWVANQFEFTARGASETLEFAADNGVTTGGPMLDAINLADITTQCVGDLDVSGDVDGADIALVLLNFGPCQTTP
jgi:hypothetical protein